MARFHSEVIFALCLITLACRVQGQRQGRPNRIFSATGQNLGLPEFHQRQSAAADDIEVPDGIEGGQLASSADLPGSFFQKVRDLIVSSVIDGEEGSPTLDLTRLRQNGWKLLLDLGMWNPLESEEIDFEEIAAQISSELQQYVSIQAWRNVSSNCLNNTLQFFIDASQGAPYTSQS